MVGVGAVMRFHTFSRVEASPDALGYVTRASDWSWLDPWAASDREPLWIAWTKLVAAPFGYSTNALQVMTLAASIAVLFTLRSLLERWVGPAGQAAGVTVAALHPLLLRDAALGIREPVVSLLVVLLAIAVLDRRPMLVGVLTASLVAVRWEVGLICLGLVLIAVLRSRLRPSAVVIALSLTAVVMVPFFLANAEEHGDPLHHSNRHARYYRNIEDALRNGENPYELPRFRGEPLSWGEYYLDYVGPAEAVERISEGTVGLSVSVASFDTSAYNSLPRRRIGFGIVVACGVALYRRRDGLALASATLAGGVLAGYGALYRWAELRLVSVAVLTLAVAAAAAIDEVHPRRRRESTVAVTAEPRTRHRHNG